MNKFCSLLFGLILIPFCTSAEIIKADEFTLENGLHCVVIENRKAPIIKHMMWYKAGAVDDKLGKGGTAHLLEHLMFRGTKKVKDGEFNQIMHQNGISSNAFTGHDFTAYHQMADISRLEVIMALEADRMENLDFSDKAFKTERAINYEERKEVVENNPASPFYERVNTILYGGSPYGRPVTGYAQEIKNLKPEDVREFYQTHYAPNNAILVLAGDIDVPTAKRLAQKYYGSIKARKLTPRQTHTINDTSEYYGRLEMKSPLMKTSRVINKMILPAKEKLKDKIYDYEVLAEYLGGDESSPLYQELVVNQKKFVSLSAYFDYEAVGNSKFVINLVPVQDIPINEAMTALEVAINKVLEEFNQEKLESTKKKILVNLLYANDNPSTEAVWAGSQLAKGFSLAEIQNFADYINAVTYEGVLNASFQVFNHSHSVEAVLLPQGGTQ